MNTLSKLHLLETYSGEEKDEDKVTATAWILNMHALISLHAPLLPDSLKITLCSTKLTHLAKTWFMNRSAELTAMRFAPYRRVESAPLTALDIVTHIKASRATNTFPTFITELVKRFRGNLSDADYTERLAQTLATGAVQPKNMLLKIRTLQVTLIRRLSYNEVWTHMMKGIPEEIMVDVRKEVNFWHVRHGGNHQ